MGLDPSSLHYRLGGTCFAGAPWLGPGPSPKRILMTLTNVAACPGGVAPPGSAILTQQAAPIECTWLFNDGTWGWRLLFDVLIHITVVQGPPNFPRGFLGEGIAFPIPNFIVCADPAFFLAHGGEARISWGPDI